MPSGMQHNPSWNRTQAPDIAPIGVANEQRASAERSLQASNASRGGPPEEPPGWAAATPSPTTANSSAAAIVPEYNRGRRPPPGVGGPSERD